MSTVTIDVRDLPARFEELVTLAASGTEVIVQNGPTTAKLVAPALAPRKVILGMHPGSMTMAPDFNDPLPDDFWGGAFGESDS